MLRDWTDSTAIEAVGDIGESLEIRLIMKADDHGRFHADPRLVKSLCYPLRDALRPTDISKRLSSLQENGLISVYEAGATDSPRWITNVDLPGALAGKSKLYLLIHRFGQRLRETKAKYPEPPDTPPPNAAICGKSPPEYEEEEISKPKRNEYPPGLVLFWEQFPQSGKDRSSRKDCLAVWSKDGLEALTPKILSALEAWKVCAQWGENNGQYVPGAHRWLAKRKYEDVPARANGAGKSQRQLDAEAMGRRIAARTEQKC